MARAWRLAAFVVFASICLASHASADVDQTWVAASVSGKPFEKSNLLLWFDGAARWRDGARTQDYSAVRAGVGWRVRGKLDLYVGVARTTTYRDTGDATENRLWEQALYPVSHFAGGALSGRTRLEQRFREGSSDTGWRLRQQFRYTHPIGATPLSAVVWDEYFWGLNRTDWGQAAAFDQNRLFLGASWQVSPHVRLEGGYLNQEVNARRDVTRDNVLMSLVGTF